MISKRNIYSNNKYKKTKIYNKIAAKIVIARIEDFLIVLQLEENSDFERRLLESIIVNYNL